MDEADYASASLWRFGDAEFDELRRELRLRNQPVDLESKPLEVLLCLLRHAGEVVTKEELLDTVWPGVIVVEGSLSTAISKLRRALDDEAQTLVTTVPRFGYKLSASVQRKAIAARELAGLSLKAGDAVPGRDQWRLLRRLDLSAYSEVWLCEQAKTREQRVFKFAGDGLRLRALKREATVARLLRESLGERPEFVRVLEWNFDASPYFLESEYGGSSLPVWAEAQGGLSAVPSETRLQLLVDIASAIAIAHGAGILHRDLKPANVLIADRADGSSQIKIADFGSAQLIAGDRIEALSITRLGFTQTQDIERDPLTGTPLYLAPEVMAGQMPTAGADIYALGVVLYQLCVGDFRKPMAAGWENDIEDPLLRTDIAEAAAGDPARRLKTVADLVWRLQHLASRRTARATLQAAEERARLAELALQRDRARRPWVGTAIALLIAGLGASLLLYGRAEQARNEAQRQYKVAQAVNQFMNRDLIAAANPVIAGRADISVRAALQTVEPLLSQRFANEPDILASLHTTLAETFYQITDFARAEQHFAKAAGLYADTAPDAALAARAQARRAEALARLSRFDEADAQLDLIEKSNPDATGMIGARVAMARAQIRFAGLQHPEAVPLLERAVALSEPVREEDPAFVDTVRLAYASALGRVGRSAEAEPLLRSAIRSMTQQYGAKHPLTLGARHTLGRTLQIAGRTDELVGEYESLVADFTEVLGPDNDNTLQAQQGLSNVYFKLERWRDHLDAARAVYQRQQAKLGDAAIQTMVAAVNYSGGLVHNQQPAVAARLLETHLALANEKLGADSPITLFLQINLIAAYIDTQRRADAQRVVDRLRSAKAGLLADDDIQGEIAFGQGRLSQLGGHSSEARSEYEAAINFIGKKNPPDHWLIRAAKEQLNSLPATSVQATQATAAP